MSYSCCVTISDSPVDKIGEIWIKVTEQIAKRIKINHSTLTVFNKKYYFSIKTYNPIY